MPARDIFKPGLAMVLSSTLVGVAVFVGVLLYGPEPESTQTSFSSLGGGGFSSYGVQNSARALAGEGRDAEAIQILTGFLDKNPDTPWGWMFAAQLCLRQTGTENDLLAKAEILEDCRANLARLERESKLPQTLPTSNYTNWFVAGWAAWASGDEPRASEIFMVGLTKVEEQRDAGSPSSLYDGACFLALAGQTERAAERIAQLAEVGYRNPGWLRLDPDLDSLRGHPVFEAALGSMEERAAADAEAARVAQAAAAETDASDPEPEPGP